MTDPADPPRRRAKPGWKPVLRRALATAAAIYAALVALMFGVQRSLMYLPQHEPEAAATARAASVGMAPWRADDGTLLGWRPVGALSRLPARISVSVSPGLNRREPQAVQKERPLKVRVSPADEKAEAGQTANSVKGAPLSFRQSPQWQRPTREGSPRTV